MAAEKLAFFRVAGPRTGVAVASMVLVTLLVLRKHLFLIFALP